MEETEECSPSECSEWTDDEREKSLADWVVDSAIEEYLMAKARRKRENQRIG